MKLNIDELQTLFNTTNNAENIVRDDNRSVVSFDYMKKYKNGSSRIIKVSTYKKQINKDCFVYTEEEAFFEILVDNIKDVTNIGMSGEKIIKFELNGKKYKTDKLEFPKLFDFLNFQTFYKVVKQRFYSEDDLLRNGYFSGLIGTNDFGLKKYLRESKDFDLFDVDFNSAYPYCFKFPLPFGKFYTAEEWEEVKDKFVSFTNFYKIKIKSLSNEFDAFIPPPPFVECSDFDFLLSRENSSMVVSAERLKLIDFVYGEDVYIVKKKYFCATKKYLKLSKFADEMFERLAVEKKLANYIIIKALKICLNSLVGNFGRRDEKKSVNRLYLTNNAFVKDAVNIEWETKKFERLNYLPISMMINDITAGRLLNLLTDEKCIRICYNTDGGIVAVRKNTQVINSKKIGMLKTKKIEKPLFYSCTMLYNRPLVYDFANDEVYNSNSIHYDESIDEFIFTETMNINCRKGFISLDNAIPLAIEKYKGFNFRESEILLKIQETALYKELKKSKESMFEPEKYEFYKASSYLLEKLCNPFDELYNKEIRKKPAKRYKYEQICLDESFFK